jgi:hypothetical protein
MPLMPQDPSLLAAAVADALVLAADASGKEASLFYWTHAQPCLQLVVSSLGGLGDGPIRELGQRLLAAPDDSLAYWSLRAAVEGAAADSALLGDLLTAAWRAACTSRLGFELGSAYPPDVTPVTWRDLAPLGPRRPPGLTTDASSLIVIPFRDNGDGYRLRNLLACLLALRDQSAGEGDYLVTVVENDQEPRWRHVIAPHCDLYLHASRPGPFNKSWTVNVGVTRSPRTETVCVHDADILPDADFVQRNLSRFLRPGTGGHLTFRQASCLDERSSAAAIRDRVIGGKPAADLSRLRRFLLRRPPGGCVWLRMDVFLRINGMDERYEGWGGEDNDFVFRADREAPFDVYDDVLLHLYHPPSSIMAGDDIINAGITPLSWPRDRPIGVVAQSWPAS